MNPRYTLADAPAIDVFVIPGGQGTRSLMYDAALISGISKRAATAERVLSVCTGALLLAKCGLLDGLTATTHHAVLELLREVAPRTAVRDDVRFVDNGKVITSAGVAAGIDMSLYVVEKLLSREIAVATARHIEYPWSPASDRVRPKTAIGYQRSDLR